MLGTAAQNVEEMQRHLCIEVEAMGPILRLLVASSSVEVRAKALYACSALVRVYPAGQRQFEETGGVSALVELLATEEPLGKLSRKAVVMLTDMLMHAEAGQEARWARPCCTTPPPCAALFSRTWTPSLATRRRRACYCSSRWSLRSGSQH